MKRYTLFLVHLFVCVFFLLPLEAQAQQIYKKRNGIIIVKKDSLLRALSAFTGLPEGGTWYANAVNAYQEAMGNNIQVYSMIIPISSAFYWPENYYQVTNNSQRATLDTMFANMNKKVKKIDVWEIMKQHKEEAIYARTDHHWLPLAAYYAAQMFANVAKVPFRNLMAYDENIIRRFNRKVLQSGVLSEAKASMRFSKPLSKVERRKKAIVRNQRRAEKAQKMRLGIR